MIGQTISHYKILEKLGEGGMGVVYKAEDTKLHRTVALKFLPQNKFSSKTDSARFEREAQAAATLHHPNIATIFEFNEFENASSHTTEAFIAMEYVEGTTLQDIIKSGPISLDLVASIVHQLATALNTAHRKNIIHQDLKPGNIIVTPDSVVKILDFGLAKFAGSVSSKDRVMAGTISYMSPEQLQGTHIDRRTDIWSLGIIMFEMLTGKKPFRGDFEPAIMYSILNEQPEPLSSLRPDVPQELAQLVGKCLRKDPSSRVQTMEDIAQILEQNIAGERKMPAQIRQSPFSRRIAMAMPGLVVMIILLWYVVTRLIDAGSNRLTVAIMPFQNETGDTLLASWPTRIQQYLSTQITGTQNVAVMYEDYLNDLIRSSFGTSTPPSDSKLTSFLQADINYLITGKIFKQGSSFSLQANLVQTKDGSQLQSFLADFAGEERLGEGVGHLAEQILAYVHTAILQSDDDDLAIWKQRRPMDWRAVEEFSAASELILNDQDASARLLRAIELDSTFLSPRIWMIPLLVQHKKSDEVERHYEFLLRMKPDANSFESAMIDWVGAFRTTDYARQAHFLRLALLSSKGNRILLHNLAYAESMRGNYKDAVDALEPCLRTKWRYAPVYRVAGECLLKMRDVVRATSLLNDALANDWVDPRVYAMLAAIYKSNGDKNKSLAFEQQALKAYRERNRPFGLAYERIGGYLTDLNELDSARAMILRALDEDPHAPSYHDQLAQVFFLQGKMTEAEEESLRALALDALHANSHLMLGKINEQKGNRTGAIQYYTQYMRFDSTSFDAQFARQRLQELRR